MHTEVNKYKKLYISKINRVQDYIEQNLEKNSNIETLSAMVNFSPYYFHRLFKHVTGEPLYAYIKRLRLEKAMFLLDTHIDKSITEIALNVGFSNPSSFAKAFKIAYGVSASGFRESKNGQQENNNGKAFERLPCYNNHVIEANMDNVYTIAPCSIEVKNVETKNVIYLRHTGYYNGDVDLFYGMFITLYKWAEARGLVTMTSKWIVLYHDMGHFTEDEKLRMSTCLKVDKDVDVEDTMGKYTLLGGKYAIGRFKVSDAEYQKVWDYMLFKWLPESGYKFDDRIPYEEYAYDAHEMSERKRLVDIYIPIRLL